MSHSCITCKYWDDDFKECDYPAATGYDFVCEDMDAWETKEDKEEK